MKARLVAAVAAGLVVLTATAAEADVRGSVYARCDFKGWWVSDPLVATQWNDFESSFWDPTVVTVRCPQIGCVQIDSVLASEYDATAGSWRGSAYWKLPKGWTHGHLRWDRELSAGVPKGHRKFTVVTLKRKSGNYCTVVNDRLAKRG